MVLIDELKAERKRKKKPKRKQRDSDGLRASNTFNKISIFPRQKKREEDRFHIHRNSSTYRIL